MRAPAKPGRQARRPQIPDDPALRQRRKFFRDSGLREHHRKIIAEMLEANRAYRTVFEDGAVKLFDAKISHPLITLTRDRVPIEGYKETEYCVAAAVDFPLLPPISRTALVTINEANGSEKVHAEIGLNYTPHLCLRVQYDPFPELERARGATKGSRKGQLGRGACGTFRRGDHRVGSQLSTFSAAMKAPCGMSTPTDHARCDDDIVPVICPTCQMAS